MIMEVGIYCKVNLYIVSLEMLYDLYDSLVSFHFLVSNITEIQMTSPFNIQFSFQHMMASNSKLHQMIKKSSLDLLNDADCQCCIEFCVKYGLVRSFDTSDIGKQHLSRDNN